MTQNRTENAVRNVLFGLINKLVTLIMPFVVRTIIIYTIGTEYVGLSSLFTSLLNVLNLSELGFRSAIVYSLYKPIAEKNMIKVNALLNEYKRVYRIVGIVILIAGGALLPFLDNLVKGDCPPDVNLYLLFIIYLINTVSSYFLFAYKSSLLLASQRGDIISKVDMTISFIEYVLQIVLLLMFRNYYIYIIIVPLYTISNNIVCAYITTKLSPEYKAEGTLTKAERKDLYYRTSAVLGHKIGATIINSADSLVISAFLGLRILGIYSNYYYLMASVISIFTIIYTSIVPSVGNSIATESKEKNYYLFMTLFFGSSWLVCWFTCCFLCLYQPFMKIWVGTDRMLTFDNVVCLVFYFYTWQFRSMGLHFKDAAGMWKKDILKPYIGAVINIITNIVLVQLIGLKGALLSTIIIFLFIYYPWETRVLFKYLFCISAKKYIQKSLGYLLVTVIACILTYLLCNIPLLVDSIATFVIRIVICTVAPNAIFMAAYSRTVEFESVLRIVKSVFAKKREKYV